MTRRFVQDKKEMTLTWKNVYRLLVDGFANSLKYCMHEHLYTQAPVQVALEICLICTQYFVLNLKLLLYKTRTCLNGDHPNIY